MKRLLLFLIGVSAGLVDLVGADELPAIFSDHLVLQRDRSVRVWGRSEPADVHPILKQPVAVRVHAAFEALVGKSGEATSQLAPTPLHPTRRAAGEIAVSYTEEAANVAFAK